jgi:hypothetical protein
MRTRRLIIPVIALALVYGACGSDEESDPELPLAASGEPEALAFELPAPAHGGTVVPVGQQAVEVVPRQDGTLQAYVVTPEPPPREQTQITVRVPGDDGRPHPVVLTWDPRTESYAGRLRRVQPVAGPVEVIMVVDGQRHAGRAPRVVLLAPSAPSVVVEAPRAPQPEVHVIEPERPTVVVEAPSRPTIVVERPQPTIVVERPHPTIVVERPRPTIVVERPHPTVVVHAPGPHVRVHHDNGRHRGHGRHGRGRVRFRH